MQRKQPAASNSHQAAMYVRMSTEHQQYSIANQSDAIERYAEQHSLTIVKQFVDSGKSGLTLTGRPALRQLLLEVISAEAGFDHILVYDVSRWGRFQDADESAYYEYMCKKANVQLHYCVEQFTNDSSPYSSLIKAIKRTMAGEFSRELSAKVHQGQLRLASMGYRQGGTPGYGLRRLLVDSKGNSKGVLGPGERKTLQADRVVLIPGPKREISVLRQIFELFTIERKSETKIAKVLNERKIPPERSLRYPNGRWTTNRVHQVLTNPKYVGINVYNRKSMKLRQKRVKNPQEQWICKETAFKPLIPADLYSQAQKIVMFRSEFMTEAEMLESLRLLLKRVGKLTTTVINDDVETPCAATILRRFGSMVAAYKLIDYKPDRDYKGNGRNHYERVRPLGAKSLADEIREAVACRKLPKTFDIPTLKKVCPGWAKSTYTTFVGHYSTDIDRFSGKLIRVSRGRYRLKST